MGVDTKAFIIGGKIEDIFAVVKRKISNEATSRNTSSENYDQFLFEYKEENRILHVFSEYKHNDFEEMGILLDFGHWGYSVEIMESILTEFGGYLLENDCDGEWQYISKNSNHNLTSDEHLEKVLFEQLKNENISFKEKVFTVQFIKKNLDTLKNLI